MLTELKKVERQAISQAADLLAAGEVVAFPTETVYGLGADALNWAAVAKIFAAKGRPADNPLIVHLYQAEQAEALAYTNELFYTLAKAFWPGPLTLIVPKKDCVPAIVTAGLDSVALRVPAHPAARWLLQAGKMPLAAPSANSSGKPSPTLADHVYQDLQGKIPLILDGGAVNIGLESTVVSLVSSPPAILRPGKISYAELLPYLSNLLPPKALAAAEAPRSPGMKYTHYSPQGQVLLAAGGAVFLKAYRSLPKDKKLFIIATSQTAALLPQEAAPFVIAQTGDIQAYAHNIFAAFRSADAAGAELILTETVPVQNDDVSMAIMNRLNKAAGIGS